MQIDQKWVDLAKRILNGIGYEYGHWARTVMYQECFKLVNELGPDKMDALEISAGDKWQKLGFRSFTEANYPAFDICKDKLDRTFDIIIADQVWGHLLWPYRATRNVYDMLPPGGYFLVTTSFMIRQHAVPVDCSRWTELGMKYFLAECGFPCDGIKTASWGNRACVKANFKRWARRGWFGSLRNEPDFPVVVWALARKD
jgi:SAM-dependent methyltransferase